MNRINNLVIDVQESATIRSKVDVDGLNLPLEIKDVIHTALIIQGPNSNRAVESVRQFDYNAMLVPSFYHPDRFGANITIKDYHSECFRHVEVPEGYTKGSWAYQVKLHGQHLSYYEVCRVLNHMSAWEYSIRTNEAVIVLEHDSILTERHDVMSPRFNSINMLSEVFYHQHNDNWVCGAGVYAYAVDCRMAKRLFNKVMSEGIINPLELMFRVDEFNVSIFKKATRLKEISDFIAQTD